MTNANDLAYPSTIVEVDKIDGSTINNFDHYGLTKREYFAAMALQGLLADSIPASIEVNVRLSVQAADALIKALNQTP